MTDWLHNQFGCVSAFVSGRSYLLHCWLCYSLCASVQHYQEKKYSKNEELQRLIRASEMIRFIYIGKRVADLEENRRITECFAEKEVFLSETKKHNETEFNIRRTAL